MCIRDSNYLFIGGAEPTCQDSADADNNGSLQLTDGVFILMFLFNGGAPPPDPGAECGVDPADPADAMACDSYDSCL